MVSTSTDAPRTERGHSYVTMYRDVYYYFKPDTGLLLVSMKSGDLEILLQMLGEIPSQGINLELPRPDYHAPAKFEGVRRIEAMRLRRDWEYLIQFVDRQEVMSLSPLIPPSETIEQWLAKVRKNTSNN